MLLPPPLQLPGKMANFHLLARSSMVALSERLMMLTYLIKRHVVLFYQKITISSSQKLSEDPAWGSLGHSGPTETASVLHYTLVCLEQEAAPSSHLLRPLSPTQGCMGQDMAANLLQ